MVSRYNLIKMAQSRPKKKSAKKKEVKKEEPKRTTSKLAE